MFLREKYDTQSFKHPSYSPKEGTEVPQQQHQNLARARAALWAFLSLSLQWEKMKPGKRIVLKVSSSGAVTSQVPPLVQGTKEMLTNDS